jgi:hypothetical protein
MRNVICLDPCEELNHAKMYAFEEQGIARSFRAGVVRIQNKMGFSPIHKCYELSDR